jgi:hypothetical protein
MKSSYSFLVIGKTSESTETGEGFKRYVGLGSSFVKAVNPSKAELDEIMGYESANEPEYVVDGAEGKEARITFIVRTDPKTCNGIEITNRVMFTLRNAPAYSMDKSSVQVIDEYGFSKYVPTEDAKAGKKILNANGTEAKLGPKYRIACVGEPELVEFLRIYLGVKDPFDYKNGSWVLKPTADDSKFMLEHIKDYFSGDFSEIKEAIACQPNNKIKLLYGVRTTEDNRQYQTVCTRHNLMLRNNAPDSVVQRAASELARIKNNGGLANTEYKVQELQEYTLEPTNLNPAPAIGEDDLPFAAAVADLPWNV